MGAGPKGAKKNGKYPRTVVLLAWALVVAVPALAAQSLPKGMFEVHPISPSAARPGAELQLASGQFFTYALPRGWRVERTDSTH